MNIEAKHQKYSKSKYLQDKMYVLWRRLKTRKSKITESLLHDKISKAKEPAKKADILKVTSLNHMARASTNPSRGGASVPTKTLS